MEFRDSVSIAKTTSKKAQGEKNDCVVRGIMNAFEVDYDVAHEWVAKSLGRKKHDGVINTETKLFKMYEAKQEIFGKQLKFLGNSPKQQKKVKYIADRFKTELVNKDYKHKPVAYTIATFGEKFKKGSYILLVREHVLCIKDGVIYDNPEYKEYKGLRRPVEQAFQII